MKKLTEKSKGGKYGFFEYKKDSKIRNTQCEESIKLIDEIKDIFELKNISKSTHILIDACHYLIKNLKVKYFEEIIDDKTKYKEFTKYDYELNRKVPFIIWTKNNQMKKEVKTVMGMYDVLPTLGNMLGIHSDYALGHDVFSIDENFVVFPNGSWVTDKMYYDNQAGQGILINQNDVISAEYIKKYTDRAEVEVNVSNNIIVHDLIKKSKESKKVLKEGNNG